ncbi:hypothetical protein CROQUDRAFT_39502 [Cronartium quercuum f. sp. fusiforme G11]|uniref:MFS general substrate transporter n=1 Tax=Cronartium quercuum f. sp. fusiforme G11 TaxID=708437 RepID=A0A9P6TFI2_9BASI|nr:hypothetical protein CROQUDRAFT_39502 [Cronartium quercuum f. sp. fusiforme G11]
MTRISGTNLATASCAMANALTAGSVFTYPVFSPALQSLLHFSVKQVAATASIAILCQYVCAALWGALADRRGSALVSLAAGLSFFLGYMALSILLSASEPSTPTAPFHIWIAVTLAYSVCGSATGGSYFAAITGATQVFGISHPGLSIAGPASLFGLSPLLFTFIGTRLFGHDDQFDVFGYLHMLAGVTLVVNLCGWIGLPEPARSTILTPSHDSEREPLISQPTRSHPKTVDAREQSTTCETMSHDVVQANSVARFLTQPSVWCLGLVVLLTAGPAEMTVSSIGAVADSFISTAPVALKARHVQLMSLANTLTRLGSGWLSDKLCRDSPQASRIRLSFMAFAPMLYATVCCWIMLGGAKLWLLSITTGICYGTIFTMAPSIVATTWPMTDFGRNYGIISYFAAVGSFAFTFLFGVLFDQTVQRGSIRLIYGVSGLSELLAVGFTIMLYRYQHKHEQCR